MASLPNIARPCRAWSRAPSTSFWLCHAARTAPVQGTRPPRRSLAASARTRPPKAAQEDRPTITWNPERGRARSNYGVVKPPIDSFSGRIAQRLQLPKFRARSSNIRILQTPASFYTEIKAIIAKAQTRIYLSSLYIGKNETELIDCIRQALQRKPYLRVLVLADALRSTREGPLQEVDGTINGSGASLLASLVRDFPHQVDVRLYRTPGLPPWLEKVIGKRLVEGMGLQHMKVYGSDDEVIMSGANLSNDYFTNRQDRYVHISQHRLLSNYLHSLLLLTSQFSYNLKASGPTPSSLTYHSPYTLHWDDGADLLLAEDEDGNLTEDGVRASLLTKRSEYAFAKSAGEALREFTNRWRVHTQAVNSTKIRTEGTNANNDTSIVPLIQMGPMGITQETDSMPLLFEAIEEQEEAGQESSPVATKKSRSAVPKATVDLTSGYFSLYPAYQSLILKATAMIRTRIVTAAPISNGFFESKGISRHLPPAYTWMESRFWNAVKEHGKTKLVTIREWEKKGWTYHAKGLWYTRSSQVTPTVTLLGSSNFGARSALRDLECTLLIETAASSSLSRSLKKEVEALREYATVPVDDELFQKDDRKVHWGVKVAAQFIKGRL